MELGSKLLTRSVFKGDETYQPRKKQAYQPWRLSDPTYKFGRVSVPPLERKYAIRDVTPYEAPPPVVEEEPATVSKFSLTVSWNTILIVFLIAAVVVLAIMAWQISSLLRALTMIVHSGK